MSSEVKLIVQNDVTVNENDGSFNLNFAGGYLEGKKKLFLSKDDDFMINSFKVNVDTNDINHTSYLNEGGIEIDVGQGEIKYVLQNVRSTKKILDEEQKKLTDLETYLDSKDHSEWKEVTPYMITFHVNYKEDVFSLEEFEIATKLNLELVPVDPGKISYKDELEATFSKSKYSYIKHLSEINTLHFYHPKCELKLANNVTSSIRFFQESIHEEKDFASKFCIHVIPESRQHKYYNYFDFSQFFEFYQIHKLTYVLDVGRAFYAYLSKSDTDIHHH